MADETSPVYTNMAGADPSDVTADHPPTADEIYPGDKFRIVLKCNVDNQTIIAAALAQLEPTLNAMPQIQWDRMEDVPVYTADDGSTFHAIIYEGTGLAPSHSPVALLSIIAATIISVVLAWSIVVYSQGIIKRADADKAQAAASIINNPDATAEQKAAATAVVEQTAAPAVQPWWQSISSLAWAAVAIGGLLVLNEVFGGRGKEVTV